MEVNVRAEGCRLRFDVLGHQSERRGRDSYDNWPSGTITVDLAQPPRAVFRAECGTSWQTVDFARFQEALRTLSII